MCLIGWDIGVLRNEGVVVNECGTCIESVNAELILQHFESHQLVLVVAENKESQF